MKKLSMILIYVIVLTLLGFSLVNAQTIPPPEPVPTNHPIAPTVTLGPLPIPTNHPIDPTATPRNTPPPPVLNTPAWTPIPTFTQVPLLPIPTNHPIQATATPKNTPPPPPIFTKVPVQHAPPTSTPGTTIIHNVTVSILCDKSPTITRIGPDVVISCK